MTVSALNFKKYQKGAMQGFLDVRYHGLTIKGCRLMSSQNGLWISLPQKEIDIDGERKWLDIIELTRSEADHVRKMVIADLHQQGHLERPAAKAPAPQSSCRTPEGEDISEHYTPDGEDDIPF